MSHVQNLQHAVMAAKAGNPSLARVHLHKAAEEAPNDPAVWLWMGWLSESPVSMVQCLEAAMQDERHHNVAQAGLAFARALSDYQVVAPEPADAVTAGGAAAGAVVRDGTSQPRVPSDWDPNGLTPPPLPPEACGTAPFNSVFDDSALPSTGAAASTDATAAAGTRAPEDAGPPPVPSDIWQGHSGTAAPHAAPPQETAPSQVAVCPAPASRAARSDWFVIDRGSDGSPPGGLARESSGEPMQGTAGAAEFPAAASSEAGASPVAVSPPDSIGQPAAVSVTGVAPRQTWSAGEVWGRPDGLPGSSTVLPSPAVPAGSAAEHSPAENVPATGGSMVMAAGHPTAAELLDAELERHRTGFSETGMAGGMTADRPMAETPAAVSPVVPPFAAPKAPLPAMSSGQTPVTESDRMKAAAPEVETPACCEPWRPSGIAEPGAAAVSVPASDSAVAEPGAETAAPDVAGPDFEGEPLRPATHPRTVLVVDDSPTVRKLVAMTLEKNGYRVVSAFDGVAAIREIAEHNPALILMDVNMPRMDGYQLCRLVRRHEATRHIPVLMLSGRDGVFDRLRGRMVGCSGYVPKPFVPEELVQAVGEHIGAASR